MIHKTLNSFLKSKNENILTDLSTDLINKSFTNKLKKYLDKNAKFKFIYNDINEIVVPENIEYDNSMIKIGLISINTSNGYYISIDNKGIIYYDYNGKLKDCTFYHINNDGYEMMSNIYKNILKYTKYIPQINENIIKESNLDSNKKYLYINLIDKYKKNNSYSEIRNSFNKYKFKIKDFTDTNDVLNLKTSDTVSFISGYNSDIIYTSEILGFDDKGYAFMTWDSYWAPIDLSKRLVTSNELNTILSSDNYIKVAESNENIEHKDIMFLPGHVYKHKEYGNGKILKDREGLCKDNEVVFMPFDKTKLKLNVLGKEGSALHNELDKAKFDIVNTKDLELSESVNDSNFISISKLNELHNNVNLVYYLYDEGFLNKEFYLNEKYTIEDINENLIKEFGKKFTILEINTIIEFVKNKL